MGRARTFGRYRAPLGLGLLLLAACGTSPDPLAERLVGSWRPVKVCAYERAGGDPCSPVTTMAPWVRFGTDGRAEDLTVAGASGRFRLERRVAGNGTEVLLSIAGRNMGQLRFEGDTLVLGMAYVDGADRYFVRLPGS